jgi:hypothetical protein
MKKKLWTTITLQEAVRSKAAKYCKKNDIHLYRFVEELILEKLNAEKLKENS